MRYVSVFSGIEASSVAWMPIGWEPVALCESAAFPSAVLAHRLPGVLNLGDVREVAWRELRRAADVVVGGSPCQSFSVAGRRFFGVPQRRRRVYLVGRLGDPEGPAEVLLEPSCLRGNPEEGQKLGEEGPGGPGGGAGGGREVLSFAANQRGELRLNGGDGRTVGALASRQGGKQVQGIWCRAGEHRGAESALDLSPTMLARHTPIVSLDRPRRLTPVECERLQGLPDDWTRVPWRGRPADRCPDTHRYQAIGNSMCVNVMRWVGRRMWEYEASVRVEA